MNDLEHSELVLEAEFMIEEEQVEFRKKTSTSHYITKFTQK